LPSTAIDVRVRYSECDPMGLAHHSNFPVWFEMARTELLREHGVAYRDIESRGLYFVVARLNIRFRKPARYDDVLRVHVAERPAGGIKLEHAYDVRQVDGTQVVSGESTLVCVDESGRPRAVPDSLVRAAGPE